MSKKKIPTSNQEIQALKARIAELEQKAEAETKAFVSGIRDALKAAKVEAPGECTLTVIFPEAGSDCSISYRASGARALGGVQTARAIRDCPNPVPKSRRNIKTKPMSLYSSKTAWKWMARGTAR